MVMIGRTFRGSGVICSKSTSRYPNRGRSGEGTHALGRGKTTGYGRAGNVGVGNGDLSTVSPNLIVRRVGRAALRVL